MDAQAHITRLLIEEVGDTLYPGGGKVMANLGVPFIPCVWNGFHPDSAFAPGTRTNSLADFTWAPFSFEQQKRTLPLDGVPVNRHAVYRNYDWATRSVRVLIPDDKDSKNRKRLAGMAELARKAGTKPEYELLISPTSNRAVLENMDSVTLDQMQAMIDKARAAQQADPAIPESEVVQTETPDGF